MAYYPKSKAELAKIGAEAFALIDDFSGGHNSKPSSSVTSAPTNKNAQQMFHYQYQPQQAYVVRQQAYVVQVPNMRTEKVVDCYEVAKKYGGTVIVDYAKRKSVRKGFFF